MTNPSTNPGGSLRNPNHTNIYKKLNFASNRSTPWDREYSPLVTQSLQQEMNVWNINTAFQMGLGWMVRRRKNMHEIPMATGLFSSPKGMLVLPKLTVIESHCRWIWNNKCSIIILFCKSNWTTTTAEHKWWLDMYTKKYVRPKLDASSPSIWLPIWRLSHHDIIPSLSSEYARIFFYHPSSRCVVHRNIAIIKILAINMASIISMKNTTNLTIKLKWWKYVIYRIPSPPSSELVGGEEKNHAICYLAISLPGIMN